jgi:hypothetical protein
MYAMMMLGSSPYVASDAEIGAQSTAQAEMPGFKTRASSSRFLNPRAAIYNAVDYQRLMISRPALPVFPARPGAVWKKPAA